MLHPVPVQVGEDVMALAASKLVMDALLTITALPKRHSLLSPTTLPRSHNLRFKTRLNLQVSLGHRQLSQPARTAEPPSPLFGGATRRGTQSAMPVVYQTPSIR